MKEGGRKRGRDAREKNALYDFEIVSREWAGGKFFSLSETFMKKWNFFQVAVLTGPGRPHGPGGKGRSVGWVIVGA